jgi:hypothetical protein
MFGRVIAASLLFLVFAATASARPTPRQIERFRTPARMAAARPLEMSVGRDGRADVRLGPRPRAVSASYSPVATPEVPPYAWNGRLYVRQGGKEGFCSATAIDSETRRLVLTAGHCANSGPKDERPSVWSTHLEFVPGFNLGAAPYGTFVLSGRPRALPQWTKEGNPDYDLPGPSTIGVRCDWVPGASGRGWLIEGGQEIDGLTSYVTEGAGKPLTYGSYFSATTVGRLTAGL